MHKLCKKLEVSILVFCTALLLSGCGSGLCPMRSSNGICLNASGSGGNLYQWGSWLEPTGVFDTTFGTAGLTTTDVSIDRAYTMTLILSTGKSILVGTNGDGTFMMARYTVEGILDTTFGIAGIAETDLGVVDNEAAYSVVQQSDGKLILSGYHINATTDIALARYSSNGILDTTYGTAGITNTDFAGASNLAMGSVLQADGKLIIAGNSGNDMVVARYTTSGILDTTYGTGGATTTDFFGGTDVGYAIALQADGKALVAGESSNDFAIARYNSSGVLDTTFGTGGITTTDFAATVDSARAMVLQADGKIVVVGTSANNFALVRYDTSGILDTTFGTAGKTTTDFLASTDVANTVALQPNGKIVVAGNAAIAGISHIGVARYSSDGILDTTFGTAGIIQSNLTGSIDEGRGLALQPDGKILVGGFTQFVIGDFAIVRYR